MPETRQQFEAAQVEIKRYKPPSKHKIRFKRHVFQVESWIHKNGLVTKAEVMLYIMSAFDMEKRQAAAVYKEVENDFKRLGRVYG